MTDERWQDILARIQEKYTIEDRGTEERSQTYTTIERVVFTGPLGKVKIERVSHPKKVATKTLYSKRAGVASAVKYEYDHDDIVQAMRVYRWDSGTGDWAPIETDAFL